MTKPSFSRQSGWKRFLLIWALGLLILGAIGCAVLYRYLGIYEVTRPEPVMETWLRDSSADELIRQARENIQFEVTEFEDPTALYDSYLETVDTTLNLSFRSDNERSTDDELVYTVYAGPGALCSVVLRPQAENPGFGRHYWEVSEVRAAPITDLLPSLHLVVDATPDTDLSLNGKMLSEKYITENEVAIPDLTRFETVLNPQPYFVRYEVGPLYSEINLEDAYGRTISPSGAVQEGRLHYQASSASGQLVIRAPEDVQVSVNGIQLDELDISSSEAGILEDLEAYTLEGAVMTNTYRFDGLYLTPEVTAADADGNNLTPVIPDDNHFTFFHYNDPEIETILKPVAERFFNAYMEYSSHSWNATYSYNLLSRILPGTKLYNYVINSQEAMIWASGTSTDYKDLHYDNFHRISDTCYTCTVRYSADMTAKPWGEQYTYSLENAYELVFVSSMGMWFAAAMNVIAD